MTPAIDFEITPGFLRQSYVNNKFSFGNPEASLTVCLIGSCRIVPILNFLRVYNHYNGHPLEILCFDAVECWPGPGLTISDGVNARMKGYSFGTVDFLVCEHLENCGVLNTKKDSTENIFDSLGMSPNTVIRLPNWNAMFMYDSETAEAYPEYAALNTADRVINLRDRTLACKARYLSYCAETQFTGLSEWVIDNWNTTRLGWTNNHPSLPLTRQIINGILKTMNIEITDEMSAHPFLVNDMCKGTHTTLGPVDYAANNWKF